MIRRNVFEISKRIPCFFQTRRVISQHNSAPSEDLIVQRLDGEKKGIAILGLNRPKGKNAFSRNLTKLLNEAIEEISIDSEVRVVLIRSLVPGVFSAGADLKERMNMTSEEVGRFVFGLRALMNKIYNLPVPVISAIDGVALGGGLELALASDLRVASSTAKLGLVEGRLGIIPGAGGTQMLARLINPAIAKELIYTARVIDGETAKDLGIVNHTVPQNSEDNAAFSKSLEIAEEILPNGPIAMKMAKNAINKGIEVDVSTGLAIEQACYAQILPTKDRIEGLKAFFEKRKPRYTGADLKERMNMTSEEVGRFVFGLRALMNKIYNLPVPLISAIDGVALGGGLELALASDLRVASSTAKLGLVEGRLGIIPGAGGTQMLARLINPAIAKELIYTARVIDGETAKDLGIVNHTVPQNSEENAAFSKSLEIAEEILPNGPIAMKMAKNAINKGIEVDVSTGLAIEQACYAQILPTKDRIEGLKAFFEKRKPRYTGA